MIGGTSSFDLIAARPAGDFINLDMYVKELGKVGIELIFLAPGTKDQPIDLRTSRQRMEDDEAARQRAKEAGDPRYLDAKTSAGIEIATADPKRLAAYVTAARKRYPDADPNLAMLVRNLLVVDADWAAGVELFKRVYTEATGEPVGPTVLTPGVRRADGTWKHRGGGHFYFELPEGWTLPEHARTISMGEGDAKVSIFVANQYILIPPSVRPEGPYQWVGEVRTAPTALLEAIALDAQRVGEMRAARAARSAERSGPDSVDRWAERTEWRDLLEPDGWYFTGSRTSCGCPEVTAPGVHASPKSATAHEIGCRETDTSSGHGPLHIWTDNPPAPLIEYMDQTGSKTLTKLQYVSWMHHGGDDGAAIRALKITSGHLMGGVSDTATSSATADQILAGAGFVQAADADPKSPPTSTPAPAPESAPSPETPAGPSEPVADQSLPDHTNVSLTDMAKPSGIARPQGLSVDDLDPSDVSPPRARADDFDDVPAAIKDAPERPMTPGLPERFVARGFDPYDASLYPKGFPTDPELLYRIFNFSDETRTIFHKARNRRPKAVNPVALLLREMLRRGMRAPVDTRLFKGTPLSMYVVVVGRSGTGKSEAAKEDASPWPGASLAAPKWLEDLAARRIAPDPKTAAPATGGSAAPGSAPAITSPSMQPVLIPHDFDKTESIGSGQALTDHLITLEGKGDNVIVQMLPHPAVLIEEDEMLTLLRASKSDSSTIVPTLNSAWTGADIGNSTRAHGNRRTTGKYSLYMWAGLQPKFVHELLGHDDSGFFQRTFLCPVTDPWRNENKPDVPQPTLVPSGSMPIIHAGDMFTADDAVLQEIESGTEDSDYDHLLDPTDEAKSHAGQVRIRLACLAALLHGTLHITEALWDWTLNLMEVSERVDAWMRAEAEITRSAIAEKMGQERATSVAASLTHTSDMTTETAETIVQLLQRNGADGLTYGRIRANLSSTKKVWQEKALEHLTRTGLIWLDSTRYKLKITIVASADAG
jgi:hypothetical protein